MLVMAKLKDILKFIQKPSKAFASEAKTSVREAVRFGLMWLIVPVILSVLFISFKAAEISIFVIISYSLALYLVYIIFYMIFTSWLHLWAYIFGSKTDIGQTIKVVIYSSAPLFLFGWVPAIIPKSATMFASVLLTVWMLVLYIFGLKQLHKLSIGRAAGAALVSSMILTIIALIVIAIIAVVTVALLAGSLGAIAA